jgi:Cu2+-exporting ATPase
MQNETQHGADDAHAGHAGHDMTGHETGSHEHATHDEHPGHDTDDHAVHSHAGHDGNSHAGHSVAMFRDKFWWSLVLSIPVVFFSPMVAHLLGYHLPEFPGSTWIPPVLGTVIFFYGGLPFLQGAVRELRNRQPGMMTLIAMAISVAFIASWATSLGLGLELDFWWELALLIVIMLLGHWIEMRALGAASGALDALAALLPDTAERVTGAESADGAATGTDITEVPIGELAAGDVVLVRPGGRVPADGAIIAGAAELDESMITGESAAVPRAVGDTVVAGTVATDSAIRVRVTAVGEQTALAGIQRLVAEAQASGSRAQALADRAAALLFYFATAAGILTFIAWMILGSPDDAITRTVTVLVIACPHALGLAIPLVIAISTERAARAGVLVKDRLALERMRHIDVVLFDKTGTLTRGEHAVTDVAVAAGQQRGEVLRLAAAAEQSSEHPVARAIVAAALAEAPAQVEGAAAAGRFGPVADFRAFTGIGVRARVDGVELAVGGPRLLEEEKLEAPAELREAIAGWKSRGASVLYLVRAASETPAAVLGALALQDEVRAESRAAIAALHERGIRVAMITGDARQVADAVGADLDIDEVFAEVLPGDKDAHVAELQARGLRVAMVGDGVNDAPALARADVGIAIGAGTDVAVESAGVVLASSDPRAVLSIIELSHASYRKMVQNLVWAAGYNIVSVPLAAGVLAGVGFVLSPAAGAVLMSLSTIVVALNAQLLRRVNLDPARLAPAA